MTPRSRARGFKRSPEHKRAKLSAPHPAAAAAPFPVAYPLRGFAPPEMNQGESSACDAHAEAVLTVVACAAAGAPLPFVPSPRSLYANARSEEQPGDGPLTDDGVAPADGITALAREGVRPIQAPTPDGRFSDVWTAADVAGIPNAPPPNVGLRSTLAEDEESAQRLVVGPSLLSPAEPDFGAQLASTIANMKAGVLVGIHATRLFEAWFDSPPKDAQGRFFLSLADTSDIDPANDNDGHAVAALDYRTEADGTLSFWLRSSWGKGGDEGGVWVTQSWLTKSCMEAWRFQAHLAAAVKVGASAPEAKDEAPAIEVTRVIEAPAPQPVTADPELAAALAEEAEALSAFEKACDDLKETHAHVEELAEKGTTPAATKSAVRAQQPPPRRGLPGDHGTGDGC